LEIVPLLFFDHHFRQHCRAGVYCLYQAQAASGCKDCRSKPEGDIMKGVIVESVWMLGIIGFMVLLGIVATVGALRKRSAPKDSALSDNSAQGRGTGGGNGKA
jgi:hypothetical protein